MVNNVKKKSLKESWRKFIVSLKRRPHNIALVLMLVTYTIFSFNLSVISHTTAIVNRDYMGLCSFVVMLFSLLGMVSFLNAFPVRQKARVPMVVIMYLIQVIVLVADIIYYVQIAKGIEKYPEIVIPTENACIYEAQNVVLVHIIFMCVSTITIALIPVIGKLLNKIDTSIKVEESASVTKIDIDNE